MKHDLLKRFFIRLVRQCASLLHEIGADLTQKGCREKTQLLFDESFSDFVVMFVVGTMAWITSA